MKKIIETEVSFLIKEGQKLHFPTNIMGFKLFNTSAVNIFDLNFEKTYEDTMFKNAGIRVRKILANSNSQIELTYKQYLGERNGINNFLEITEEVKSFDYKRFLFKQLNDIGLSQGFKDRLELMNKKCEMVSSITTTSKRELFYYQTSHTELELSYEHVIYGYGEKHHQETMLEIEVISKSFDSCEMEKFISYWKNNYQLEVPNEGKSERGKKILLNI